MQSKKLIHIIGCHAEGEVGDVIVGGVPYPPGETLWQQRQWINDNEDLRNFVLNEPRGGVFRHVNFLVPAKDPRAIMGWIIMEPEYTPPMSGSNSICVSTVLLDSGMVTMTEPETRFTLEAPGGLVDVVARCRNGKVESVRILNHPSYVHMLDAKLEVEGQGTVTVDVAYGGDSFVLVDADSLGFNLQPDEASQLTTVGTQITHAANEQLGFRHPLNSDWNHISFCQFTGSLARVDGILTGRSAVAIDPGKLDRSPCGTGCSARMAVMYAKGQLRVAEPYVGLSIIGSQFDCKIERCSDIDGLPAIIPSVSGRAWITGTHQYMLDPTDPWPTGYRLSDTWPVKRSGTRQG